MLTKSDDYFFDTEAVREPYTEPLDRWGGNYLRQISITKELQGKATSLNRKRNMHPEKAGRNIRSVWEFPTQPYPEAHFATFPEKLPEICIKASTPEVGCCSKCGKPYERISERQTSNTRPGKNVGSGKSGTDNDPNQALHQSDLSQYCQRISYETLGWRPGCRCNANKAPSLVLDPFAGSGTTLLVASKLGRKSVGYELSEEYCRLIVERNKQSVMKL